MCLHSPLSCIPFTLICNMTTLKNGLPIWPNLGIERVCKDKIFACIMFYAPFPLICHAT